RFGDQCLLVSREGLSALARPLEVDRIADAERDNTIERKLPLAKHGPDVARLLTCDRDDHIKIKGSSREGRLDLGAKLSFEPSDIVNCHHEEPLRAKRC